MLALSLWLHRYTGHTFAKFVITILTGIITGMFAVGLSTSTHYLLTWKNEVIQGVLDMPGEHRVWVAFIWHCVYSCTLVSCGVALVSFIGSCMLCRMLMMHVCLAFSS